ncbi:hypothetical protein ACL7TT_06620 [Microbulbifer sp. 2304DJ12-6]|uniref:hypothetical protein n=1 Tax=Microbulbifer sp. 2304DJ12-6 TaxID=3233340 RepID=UPI0039AF3FF2
MAEDKALPVGYLTYYPLPLVYALIPWLLIKELYVIDRIEYRRRGVGKALMSTLAREAQ